jgi:hypothetical protein
MPISIFAPNGLGSARVFPLGGRCEGREQGGGDEPRSVFSFDSAGGGVLGCRVHEAEDGCDQPLVRQIAAEDADLLASPDEILHPAQRRHPDLGAAQHRAGGLHRRAAALYEEVDQSPPG